MAAKISPAGDLAWVKLLSNVEVESRAHSLKVTSDGGYLVFGDSNYVRTSGSSIGLYKLSSEGSLEWAKEVSGIGDTRVEAVAATEDGFVMSGKTGNQAILVALIDETGAVGASFTLAKVNDEVMSVQVTSDNAVLICGATYDIFGGLNYFLILKVDAAGNILWQKQIKYSMVEYECSYAMEDPVDGSIYFAGKELASPTHSVLIYGKAQSDGTLLWLKKFGDSYTIGMKVLLKVDGSLLIAGSTNSDGAGDNDFFLL